METLTLLFLKQYLRYGANQNAQMKPAFITLLKTFLTISDGSFWERMKTLEDQRVIIKTHQMWRSFFLSKSFHESSDSNSNTINTTPTISFPSNTPVCPNYNKDVSLLSEGIDSLEQFFDTQLQNLTQISPVKSNSKGTNTNNESDILTKSLQETIFISKKELINKVYL